MNNMDHINNLGVNSGSLEGLTIPATRVAPTVLLNIILYNVSIYFLLLYFRPVSQELYYLLADYYFKNNDQA